MARLSRLRLVIGGRCMKGYLPVALAVQGKVCVVVGGGPVALRKVLRLLAEGARVRVVSPSLVAGLQRLVDRGEVEYVRDSYRPELTEEAFLIVAATNSRATNCAIAATAKARGVLVNVANPGKESSVIFCAALRHGDLEVAVHSAGESPRRSARLRSWLQGVLGGQDADATVASKAPGTWDSGRRGDRPEVV